MGNYKRVGLTRGEVGKLGYLHATLKITDQQDRGNHQEDRSPIEEDKRKVYLERRPIVGIYSTEE